MDSKILMPGVRPREVWAWSAFDFANSGYTTVVLTAVFNAYFVSVVAGDAPWATFAWTCIIAASNAASLVLMPVVGAVADAAAKKKLWLFAATACAVAGTVGLAFCGPGTIALAALMVIVSNIGYNVGETLNSAFLPEIARPEAVGKVSGWGWSFGYCGGLVTLGASLVLVEGGGALGLDMDARIAGTMLVTAAVFLLASIPIFTLLKERAKPRGGAARSFSDLCLESFRETLRTAKSLGQYRDFAWLSLCGFLYQSGIAVVITLSAVYAGEVMGFTTTDTLLLVFLVNITAAAGAFGFGYLQDRIGHKRALGLTLLVWVAMIVCAAFATTRPVFWVAANLAGLAMGSSQSAGRAMVALLSPESRSAEFFSFWNMALWTAAIVGPLAYGSVTWITGNDHRLAIGVTGLFFVAALCALTPLNLERGMRAAGRREEKAGA
ncbi:MFS transporter [uncultured Sutterella sp.]|uniref:MFS transporter n=1 Tax=uncultured Sutterella sp. TaxID=286133 RepID=UPI0025DF2868|nr:MFS transporter [uncultured Sutterella sp.]